MSERRIGVVGGGSWGTTLAHLAAVAGSEVLLRVRRAAVRDRINGEHISPDYTGQVRLHPCVVATTDLAALRNCPLIVMAVPSQVFRGVATELGDHIDGAHLVVHATKGLERGSDLRMSEVLMQETCARKIGVLAGPNLSAEILAGEPAATVVASRFDEVIEATRAALASTLFRIYGNRDVAGVEVAGALKNVIALASGFVEGIGLGINARAGMLTRAMAEMARLGAELGADERTFSGLAGIGDLIATCSSPLSRNFTVGMELGRGRSLSEILRTLGHVAEGVHTTRVIHRFARRRRIDAPITSAVNGLLDGTVSADEVVPALMTRVVGHE